jgi:heme/copper-type cytochrome/quinol oxidase subunit 2
MAVVIVTTVMIMVVEVVIYVIIQCFLCLYAYSRAETPR